MEDLKKITIEEWNKIPLSNIRRRFAHWRKRCAKIIELSGSTLKECHINEIKNDEKNKENKENEEDDKENEDKLKLKVVYDENRIQKKKKKKLN